MKLYRLPILILPLLLSTPTHAQDDEGVLNENEKYRVYDEETEKEKELELDQAEEEEFDEEKYNMNINPDEYKVDDEILKQKEESLDYLAP